MNPIRLVHAISGFVVTAPRADTTSHDHPRTRVRIGQHQTAGSRRLATVYFDIVTYRETAHLAATLRPGDDIIATGHTRPFTGAVNQKRKDVEEFHAATIARPLTPPRRNAPERVAPASAPVEQSAQ